MANLSPKVLLEGNSVFTEFKGSLAEQYVFNQLKGQKGIQTISYWSSAGTAEVDFVLQMDDLIIPMEVKAEENLKAKSLQSSMPLSQ